MKKIAFVLSLIILLAATAALGWLYLRLSPPPVCKNMEFPEEVEVTPVLPGASAYSSLIASQAGRSCSEAGRSFLEWYFMNIHYDRYWVELSFTFKRTENRLSFAGIKISRAADLKILRMDTARGKDLEWDEDNLGFSLLSKSSKGDWEKSFFRFHNSGEHAGEFELKIVTRQLEMHCFLRPLTPGFKTNLVCVDPGKQGYWYRAAILTTMGEASGSFTDNTEVGGSWVFASNNGTARGYLEHFWGNHPHERLSWDWGEFGDLESEESVFIFQCNLPSGEVGGLSLVSSGEKMPLIFLQGDTSSEQRSRTAFSRFYENGGMLYPQKLSSIGISSIGNLSMEGVSYGRQRHYTGFRIRGRALWEGGSLDWNDSPVNSVFDAYGGEPVVDMMPPPPENISLDCDADGCILSWEKPEFTRHKIEYWIYKQDNKRMWKPLTVLTPPIASNGDSTNQTQGIPSEADKPAAENIEYVDTSGNRNSKYKVLPVFIPPDLRHKRLQAGYARCSEPPERGEPVALPGALREAVEKSPLTFSGPRASEDSGLSLSRSGKNLAFELDGKSLKPVFGPGVQVQSFDLLRLDSGRVAVAWSERSPIMGGPEYTDWEVFLDIYDLESGQFMVFPVSMTAADSLQVWLDKEQDGVAVHWMECDRMECRPAVQFMEIVDFLP